jgi:hypothetical protein
MPKEAIESLSWPSYLKIQLISILSKYFQFYNTRLLSVVAASYIISKMNTMAKQHLTN